MASVFVSHSSRDQLVTERVCERLRAAGFTALFVDFDPDQGIPAGRDWERELYAQLRRTDAVIFLATKAAVTSQWCFSEVSLARALGRPVIPLRLEREVRLPLLGNTQWVDFSDTEAGFDRLLAGLRAAGLDPTRAYPWDPRRSPYPGLIPFATEDAAVFFGRERETARLVELLQPTLQHGPGRFVAVVGPSGSGKSSLVCGGLLPRLSRSTTQWVPLPPLLPGPTPTRNLAAGLARAFAERSHPRSVEELAAALEEGPAGLRQLAGELAELEQNGAGRVNVLVVIDQAEELLTRAGPVEQQAFLRLLTGALGEDSPLWVVASVRSEFLSLAPDRAGLADAVDVSLMIEPLSRARLAEVIARPAQRAGLEFGPGLVERMVEDTAGGDALPLLAYTLRELCQRAGPDGQISMAHYEDIGGVVGALQHRADQLTEELRRRGHGELVVPTLLRLAAVTGYDDPIRRRVRRDSLTPEEQAVVDRFVDARLLTSNQVAPAHHSGELAVGRQAGTQHVAGTAPTATVEVAHEALLRQWPPLREAIEADRAALRRLSDLERLAADWHQGHRDESYLLRGGRLAAFDDWANGRNFELGPTERQYLEASRALATRKLEMAFQAEGRRSFEALLLVVVLGTLLAVGGSPFGLGNPDMDVHLALPIFNDLTLSVKLPGPHEGWTPFGITLAFVLVAILKGRTVLGIVGVLLPIAAMVAAVRLARPHSLWARRFYRPGSARWARAQRRFPTVQAAVSGRGTTRRQDGHGG